jgi:hypothetical protein
LARPSEGVSQPEEPPVFKSLLARSQVITTEPLQRWEGSPQPYPPQAARLWTLPAIPQALSLQASPPHPLLPTCAEGCQSASLWQERSGLRSDPCNLQLPKAPSPLPGSSVALLALGSLTCQGLPGSTESAPWGQLHEHRCWWAHSSVERLSMRSCYLPHSWKGGTCNLILQMR